MSSEQITLIFYIIRLVIALVIAIVAIVAIVTICKKFVAYLDSKDKEE